MYIENNYPDEYCTQCCRTVSANIWSYSPLGIGAFARPIQQHLCSICEVEISRTGGGLNKVGYFFVAMAILLALSFSHLILMSSGTPGLYASAALWIISLLFLLLILARKFWRFVADIFSKNRETQKS